ncbi:MAG TPA: UDP-N-acetylmuramate dehydrogenase [Acidimicrobiales bacterium]|nr:UDP-N-acetylmuramate dehydrogenase [Acidimicrobiales bacterium]
MRHDELAALLERAGGRAVEHADVGVLTTYRVGGRVRVLLTLEHLADLEELGELLQATQRPVVVIGNGSNLLIAEGEHDVIGVHLGGEFRELTWRDEGDRVIVTAGAGLDLPVAARRLVNEGVVGFEWAVGVPGTFGGAVVMNAGGHGSDMAATVLEVHTWRGAARRWSAEDLDFGYRTSALLAGEIVTRVVLGLHRGDRDQSRKLIGEIVHWRRAHQPGGANAGSVFRNPPGEHAGHLIELAGCKGLRVGSAVISEKHANFIQVDTNGSADDVYELIRAVQARVRECCDVELVSENRLIGFGEHP